jgi:predicted secreted protein
MARQKARSFILSISDEMTTPTYTPIAEIQTQTLTINNSEEDVTSKDSGGFTELFSEGSVKSVSLSVDGIVTDDTDFQNLEDKAISTTPKGDFRITDEDGDTIDATFHISDFEKVGGFAGAVTFSATLASSGTVTLTRA